MIDIDLKVVHHFAPGVYAKQMRLDAGHFAETHAHSYDHLSILAFGEVVVTIDGKAIRHVGPTAITIEAGKRHRIDAVTDSAWFCVHATNETDPDLVDRVLIKES